MRQYLLSVYQPDGAAPAPEVLDPIMAAVEVVNGELRAAGAWLFDVGLHPVEAATVVRSRAEGPLLTDGPFAEGKEHLGGFSVIQAEDLDAALAWADKLAAATTLPVEVRPIAYLSQV